MRVGDKIRTMIRSFLRIEPANRQSFQVQEVLDWQGNAFQNRIWYRGDASELNEFYRQFPDRSTQRFWSAVPTKGLEIRKIHTGLPKEIVETLSGLVIADLNEIIFPAGEDTQDAAKSELWERIAGENHLHSLLVRALNGCMVIGDGAFKLSLDPALSELPILEWYDGDRIELVQRRGRLQEVIFLSHYPKGCTLREHYGYGYIQYELLHGETPVGLDYLDETAQLQNIAFDPSFCMAIPFRLRESNKWPGRGQSFFEGKTDSFDALDEAWSQWVHAMRTSRPRQYIPDNLIPRNETNGALLKPNAFDCQFIQTDHDLTEGATNQITLQQAAFYAEQYNSTYITALDLALQGLISPSTLGIDTKKLDNAEAQREKEKTTLYTRQLMISALTEALERLVDVTFKVYATANKQPVEDTAVDIAFGEYANPSFEAVVETLSNPNTPMSIEAKVDELWGDTKDEDWKRAEVQRIRAEQGMVELDELSLADEVEEKWDESQGSEQHVPDEPEGISEATQAGV
ncbi:MAG: capsid protein [Eubacteriales bacterium]|nr:capsid protein [Eubacteriales bacterium]